MDDYVCSRVKKPPPTISQWGIYFFKKFFSKFRKFGAFLGDFFAPEKFAKKRCHHKNISGKIWIAKIPGV